jgi:hypothetical protein
MASSNNFDWQDIAISGSLAEEIAEEEKELLRIQKELEMEESENENDD